MMISTHKSVKIHILGNKVKNCPQHPRHPHLSTSILIPHRHQHKQPLLPNPPLKRATQRDLLAAQLGIWVFGLLAL